MYNKRLFLKSKIKKQIFFHFIKKDIDTAKVRIHGVNIKAVSIPYNQQILKDNTCYNHSEYNRCYKNT